MKSLVRPVPRRRFLQMSTATVIGVVANPTLLRASATDLKIGFVVPLTGTLAPTLTGVEHVVARISEALGKGIQIAGQARTISVIVKDSQSSPNRASEVTSELILQDEVDVVVTCMAPDTVNPVADQCELNEVPCISTMLPWQAFYYGRGATDDTGFDWTWHMFWGVDQVIDVFEDMWKRIPNNKSVGALWPSTGDGLSWADAERGFPPVLAERGYKISDPGRFAPLSDDFSQIIAQFKADEVEIVTGVVFPPDWTTFWTQAAQQGFKPKAASAGNCLVFPASVEALGDIGNNHSFDLFWHPDSPSPRPSPGRPPALLPTTTSRQPGGSGSRRSAPFTWFSRRPSNVCGKAAAKAGQPPAMRLRGSRWKPSAGASTAPLAQ